LGLSLDRFRDDAEGYFGSPLVNGRIDERLRDINYNVVDDFYNYDDNYSHRSEQAGFRRRRRTG
jgi:iron complex outermembrane receptor protein